MVCRVYSCTSPLRAGAHEQDMWGATVHAFGVLGFMCAVDSVLVRLSLYCSVDVRGRHTPKLVVVAHVRCVLYTGNSSVLCCSIGSACVGSGVCCVQCVHAVYTVTFV